MRLAIAACLFSIGCGPPIVHSPEVTPEPIDGSRCVEAGDHLATMGCQEAKSKKGVPYATICKSQADRGVDLFTCPIAAKNCDEVKACR